MLEYWTNRYGIVFDRWATVEECGRGGGDVSAAVEAAIADGRARIVSESGEEVEGSLVEAVRAELVEQGFDPDDVKLDDRYNAVRAVWVAACDMVEEGRDAYEEI